jgi:hypothetical protein
MSCPGHFSSALKVHGYDNSENSAGAGIDEKVN